MRQRNAPPQVPLCLLELACPDLGDAEADQRQRAQVLAQERLRRVRGPGQGLQTPDLLGHRGQIAALAYYQQPDDAKQQLRQVAPGVRHRGCPELCQAQVSLGRLQ